MDRTLTLLTALVLLGGWSSPAHCQDSPRRISQRIDLDLEDASLTEAVAEISRRSGATVLADPEVTSLVTLRLRRVQWKQALGLVAERAGCEVQRKGRYLIVTRPKDRIDIELYDANVRTALLLLARYADQSIVISPEVTGTITLRLSNVSAARAIRAVAKTAGDYVVVGERGGAWRADARGGARAGEAPSKVEEEPDRIVEGTFRGLKQPRRGRPTLLLERKEGDGSVALEKLSLARDPVVRALQVRLLRKLTKGSRLVVGVQKVKRGWVATHLVSASPTAGKAPSKGK
jgi:hypothetical protein